MEWDSPEDFTRFVKEIAPPVSNLLKPHPQEVQSETWAAITEAAREYVEDGRVRMKTWSWSPPAAPDPLESSPGGDRSMLEPLFQ